MNHRKTRSSWLLWLGFGGLLFLQAFAGLYGLSTVKGISTQNDHIRTDYLVRDRILQQVRDNLYLSGTYIRDLLLETDSTQTEKQRLAFRKSRGEIEALSAEYARLAGQTQSPAFEKFRTQCHRYFTQLESTLGWTAEERRNKGLSFMKDILLPERSSVVQLADQLSLANAHRLGEGSRQVANLFAQFEYNLVVFTVGSLSIGIFVAAFTARRVLRLERLAQQQLHELQELSSRLVEIQESERRAIARELHDEVGQSISGLLLGIGNVAATLTLQTEASVLSQLDDLRHLGERTVASVRNLSLLLRPSMLDDLGLVPALQWQARETSRTANISVKVTADELSGEDGMEEVKTCVFRIVQEALANVTRHARATAVDVRLSQSVDRSLTLEIEDNGRGFVPRDKGLGILGMEERVRHLNGSFHIKSEPGRGTTLLIHLPA